MSDAYIIDAVRTPRGIGKVGKGSLAHLHPQHLARTVLAALAKRNDLNTAEVDDIIWGTSSQRGAQGGDMGRMAALDAGYDIKASGVTLDRFCGSGITTVNLAAAQIMSGMEDLVIAGGTEMMSYTSATAHPQPPPMLHPANPHPRKQHPPSQHAVCSDALHQPVHLVFSDDLRFGNVICLDLGFIHIRFAIGRQHSTKASS